MTRINVVPPEELCNQHLFRARIQERMPANPRWNAVQKQQEVLDKVHKLPYTSFIG